MDIHSSSQRTSVVCALAAVTGVAILSALSRGSGDAGGIGAYSRGCVHRSCDRLVIRSRQQRRSSRQDEDPLLAMMHNSEAVGLAEAASQLLREYGLEPREEHRATLSDLYADREIILKGSSST